MGTAHCSRTVSLRYLISLSSHISLIDGSVAMPTACAVPEQLFNMILCLNPRSIQIICVMIISVHALRLISRQARKFDSVLCNLSLRLGICQRVVQLQTLCRSSRPKFGEAVPGDLTASLA